MLAGEGQAGVANDQMLCYKASLEYSATRSAGTSLLGLRMVSFVKVRNLHLIIIFPVDIANSKICAGDSNDVGACLGDSGGPLVTLKRADDKRCK